MGMYVQNNYSVEHLCLCVESWVFLLLLTIVWKSYFLLCSFLNKKEPVVCSDWRGLGIMVYQTDNGNSEFIDCFDVYGTSLSSCSTLLSYFHNGCKTSTLFLWYFMVYALIVQ